MPDQSGYTDIVERTKKDLELLETFTVNLTKNEVLDIISALSKECNNLNGILWKFTDKVRERESGL